MVRLVVEAAEPVPDEVADIDIAFDSVAHIRRDGNVHVLDDLTPVNLCRLKGGVVPCPAPRAFGVEEIGDVDEVGPKVLQTLEGLRERRESLALADIEAHIGWRRRKGLGDDRVLVPVPQSFNEVDHELR